MRKFNIFLVAIMLLGVFGLQAQTLTVSGTTYEIESDRVFPVGDSVAYAEGWDAAVAELQIEVTPNHFSQVIDGVRHHEYIVTYTLPDNIDISENFQITIGANHTHGPGASPTQTYLSSEQDTPAIRSNVLLDGAGARNFIELTILIRPGQRVYIWGIGVPTRYDASAPAGSIFRVYDVNRIVEGGIYYTGI